MTYSWPKMLIAGLVGFLLGVASLALVIRTSEPIAPPKLFPKLETVPAMSAQAAPNSNESAYQVELNYNVRNSLEYIGDILLLDGLYDSKGLDTPARDLIGATIDTKVLLFYQSFCKIQDEKAINYVGTTIRNAAPIIVEIESKDRTARAVRLKDNPALNQVNAGFDVLMHFDKYSKGDRKKENF